MRRKVVVSIMAVVAVVVVGLVLALFVPLVVEGPGEFDLRIQGRKLTPSTVQVREGREVTLRISSDEKAEFHIPKPYDLEVDVEPGRTAILKFEAKIPGRVDLEFHVEQSGKEEEVVIGVLQVIPRR